MGELDYSPIIMAKTLYGEARGEYKRFGIAAFIGVANVIMNRLFKQTWYGQSVDEICMKKGQFSCWNPKDPNRQLLDSDLSHLELFKKALFVCECVLSKNWPDLTNGADHYHVVGKTVSWSKAMTETVVIGSHRFYKNND